jgi:hypothetical protein
MLDKYCVERWKTTAIYAQAEGVAKYFLCNHTLTWCGSNTVFWRSALHLHQLELKMLYLHVCKYLL